MDYHLSKPSQPDPKRKKKAEALMKRSNDSKNFAAEQERLGKAQIKNKVKPGQTGVWKGSLEDLGKPLPVGAERLAIAKKARQSATKDSLQAVRMYPGITPKKKK